MTRGFDPEAFLEIAKALRKDDKLDLEARLRTAIGRAYYAAFLKAYMKFETNVIIEEARRLLSDNSYLETIRADFKSERGR